ncbi:MAG: hypothetical protein IJS45_00435 [Clostridia bacterium]|nr:hypothetical protein [Clostridia bacterium]
MKYITVTLNPAIDQTYTLDSPLKTGAVNRAAEMCTISYSGKGINVSKELLKRGVDSKVLCLLGEEDGDEVYKKLVSKNLNLFAVRTRGRIRRNISAIDPNGISVEINEPGDEADLEDIVKVLALFDKLIKEPEKKVVVISGSTPPGFRNDIYKRMTISAKERRATVILDADGELLRRGIEGGPDLIKPNEYELSSLTGCSLEGDDEQVKLSALAAASVLYEKTGVEVLCTLGGKGSVFVGKEGQFVCPAEKISAKRSKGAGDIFLANYVYERYEKSKSSFEAMKRATERTAAALEK